MKPSPLNPNAPSDWGYDTPQATSGPTAHRTLPPSAHQPGKDGDQFLTPQNGPTPGVLTNSGYSFASTSPRPKPDKVLSMDPHAKLASFYMVSGLSKEPSLWSHADTNATQGVRPREDSLNVFWRPDLLGCAFSGQKTEDWMRDVVRTKNGSKSSLSNSPLSRNVKGVHVPDTGPQGAHKLVNKTMKYAHPRDVEVVNSSLTPATTCHAFTFTVPRHDSLASHTRPFLDASVPTPCTTYNEGDAQHSMISQSGDGGHVRSMSSATDITYHGVTLTVWTHAEGARTVTLKAVKSRMQESKTGFDSLRSNPVIAPRRTGQRSALPWSVSGAANDGDVGSEIGSVSEYISGSGRQGVRGFLRDKPSEEAMGMFQDSGDIFWMPYAITLVSRHPIYDVMQDYLRLSRARYSKNAKHHMTQICSILNFDTPRPGESYRLMVGMPGEEVVAVESTFPGVLDFDRGLVKVDFQIWPFFQALDLDHILTCVEVALSNSGRIVFCSEYPAMLNIAVNSLKYIVELRGWDGITQPLIHARDVSLVIEDPGPYIIGVPSECRQMMAIPCDVVLVDIDSNALTCKTPPAGVISSRTRREKSKHKILSALGPQFPLDRSIPLEFKVSFPKGSFRNLNRFLHGPERPSYLGERLRAPGWWKHSEVITVFDKIMLDKHKKPSLIQRLTKTGLARQQAQLTVGEQLSKTTMRRRALHYVETRDDLELKVARINRRLIKLVQEGDHWKQQFETFEKYADHLALEASELRASIERERQDARRLSNIANESTKQNAELEEKLRQTELARAEAMGQLSDMHSSVQELEREREEIMNVFETQLNQALDGIPSMGDGISRRASSPSESILSSPISTHTRHVRPVTRESEQSGLSRYTTDSQSISVLRATTGRSTRKRPTTAQMDPLGSLDRLISDKSEGIAQRVASIQQKLELALNNVSAHQRSASVATFASVATNFDEAGAVEQDTSHEDLESSCIDVDANRRDSNVDSSFIETPVASRRPSMAVVLAPALPEIGHASVFADMVANKAVGLPSGNTEASTDVEPPRPSSSLSHMRPGVTLRIRPKRPDTSRPVTSGEALHDRYVTDSTEGEIILSPSASPLSLGSNGTADTAPRMKRLDLDLIDDERRTSTISMTSDTFGFVS